MDKFKDYKTLARLYVERMATKGIILLPDVQADLAEAIKDIEQFMPAHYRRLLDILYDPA